MPFEVQSFPWNEVRNGYYKNVDYQLRVLWRYLRRVLPVYGFRRFRLVPIWSNGEAAARYFAKYVVKSFAENNERDKGIRKWFLWGTARRATCNFAWVNSQARHKIGWMAGVLGLAAYEDFKELLGPKWAYYLFPVIDPTDWNRSKNAVWAIARLLMEGLKKIAAWVSREVDLGANPDLSGLIDFKPFLESYLLS